MPRAVIHAIPGLGYWVHLIDTEPRQWWFTTAPLADLMPFLRAIGMQPAYAPQEVNN